MWSVVGPRPPLDDVQRVAVRVGVLVDPHLLVLEADRIDDQRVALPVAESPRRRTTDRDRRNACGRRSESAGSSCRSTGTRPSSRPAATSNGRPLALWRGMPPMMQRLSGSIVAVRLCLQRRLAGGRQRQLEPRQILADVAARDRVANAFPVPAEIGMAIRRSRRRLRSISRRPPTTLLRERAAWRQSTATASGGRRPAADASGVVMSSAGPSLSGCWDSWPALRSAVAGRCAGDDASVGQRHAPRVDRVRAVSREVAVDDDRVAEFEVALLQPPARQRARRRRLRTPISSRCPGLVFDVDVEIRVRIRPLDLREVPTSRIGLLPSNSAANE